MEGKKLELLAWAGMGAALLGAILGALDALRAWSIYPLALAVGLVAAYAWLLGKRPASEEAESDDARFQRELALNASSIFLSVVFLLLAMVEVLAIPAALGYLVVLDALGLRLIAFYPVITAGLLCTLSGAALLAARGHKGSRMGRREKAAAQAALGLTGAFVLAGLAVSAGAGKPLGLQPERAVFLVAASLVSLFFFLRSWLELPRYSQVTDWLENEQRLKDSGLLRRVSWATLGLAALGILLSLLPMTGLLPRKAGLAGTGLAMLTLLFATFNVGVSHVVPFSALAGDARDERKKRHVILGAASVGLTVLAMAVGILTTLAFMAQVGGVVIFRSLLGAFVASYPAIFAVVFLALAFVVGLRMRVRSDLAYSDKMRALALGMSTMVLILGFFGVFIGSGLAEGSGIAIENAVLALGAAVVCLIQFVKARTLLPGIVGMIRDSVKSSASADKSQQQSIKNRMIATYVTALVFVLGFVSFIVATSLHVIPSPQSSLGTDVGFFVYLLGGIALLVIVVMRYFQSVNIDTRWQKRAQEEATIGKKRLTSAQVQRYLILGFSFGVAGMLGLIGLLVTLGQVQHLGPLPVAKKYGTDFFVFAILIGLGPYGWYTAREATRIEAIDQKFPEFLRDLAESQRAGMTLTEAVITASKGNYGVLTPEIRKMAAQIQWGVSFSSSLERFAARVDTPLIRRTVSLVIQASSAGGNVVDVLTAAADDAREIQQIVKERKQSMSIYVMIIYIAFAVFVGVIAVLNAQFIPEVAKAVSKADGVSIGGLHFKAFNQDDFKTLFFHAAVIQGFGGGIVGGIMAGGKPVQGLRHSFILVLAAWVLFRVVIG
ncbi:MAG: archaeal flagellar protein FlaJ [Thermoplasmata archaeon]|jgi:flagellar protein FlaJ|nr:archaeal flagellar protein FlaJ [Thermoplasmata archaeon]